MFNTVKPPRRRLRLPQLNKAARLARRHAPCSEFVLMAQRIEMERQLRREAAELRSSSP